MMKRQHFFYILSLMVILLCLRLSYWQWERASEKRALAEQFSGSKISYESADRLIDSKIDPQRPIHFVTLKGHYLSEQTVLIDNQMVNHNPGYDVLTPFKTLAGNIFWVNRGWVIATKDRSKLPIIKAETGLLHLHAMLLQPKKKPFKLGPVQDPHYPHRFEVMDLDELNHYFESSLLNSVMILNSAEPGAFHYHYKAVVLPAERHIGYAIQWLSLAIVWIIFTCKSLKYIKN